MAICKRPKKRRKSFVKKSKNGTLFYLEKWGEMWNSCEPLNVLFVKYNGYLLDRNGYSIKISSLDDDGYEISAYLWTDVKMSGFVDRYHLEQQTLSMWTELKAMKGLKT